MKNSIRNFFAINLGYFGNAAIALSQIDTLRCQKKRYISEDKGKYMIHMCTVCIADGKKAHLGMKKHREVKKDVALSTIELL